MYLYMYLYIYIYIYIQSFLCHFRKTYTEATFQMTLPPTYVHASHIYVYIYIYIYMYTFADTYVYVVYT